MNYNRNKYISFFRLGVGEFPIIGPHFRILDMSSRLNIQFFLRNPCLQSDLIISFTQKRKISSTDQRESRFLIVHITIIHLQFILACSAAIFPIPAHVPWRSFVHTFWSALLFFAYLSDSMMSSHDRNTR